MVPHTLIVLGSLDNDYLQTAVERLNVFRRVFTWDSFLTLALSQRKGVGRHMNTWARHGTSICKARCAARAGTLRSLPILPMPFCNSHNKTHIQMQMKLYENSKVGVAALQ